MQRGAVGSAGSSHARLPRVSGPITPDEQHEFGLPGNLRDAFLGEVNPTVQRLVREGHRSKKVLCARLNAEGCRTAQGRHWNVRLVGFLLGFLSRRHQRRKANRASSLPKASASSGARQPLTAEEIARRLSALGRIKR